jgi:zinc/manganese transport system substrate-binding protein
VVATYSILGDLVADLVGDAAKVIVVIPNGQDQHEFEPSAKVVEQINNADFIVSNGLDLEEHLTDVLAEAATRGVGVFMVAEHVTVRKAGAELTDAKDGNDPHLWLDPITLAEMIPDLSNELGKVLGVDLSDNAAQLSLRLATIDVKIKEIMTTVPRCALVTGHDSLGYFAARYGCQIVGAVIPSLSSSAETSAGELADLKTAATQANVRAVFTEMGTPRAVVDQIAKEVGVKSVELRTHMLPTGGHYADVMIRLATSIADALK